MPPFVDPYVYPGTAVLINRPGLRSEDELRVFEYNSTFARRLTLDTAVARTFDADHLRAIHHHLFEPLFDWAGTFRTVDITKGGSTFMPVSFLETGAQTISASLGASGLLDPDVDEETFIHEAAGILGDLNYLHPFREGNGRTQRAFLDHVAARSSRRLAWRNVGESEQRLAAIRTFNEGNGDAFEPLLRKALA